MGEVGHISATASLNIDPFQQSTRVLEQQAKAIDRTLRATEISFKNTGKTVNGMKATYDATGKSVSAYTALLNKQQKEYEEYVAKIGDVNNATDKEVATLMKKEQAIANTTAKLEMMKGKQGELAKAIAIQENQLINSGKALEEFGNKAEKNGERMQKFGSAATKGLTLPIVAGVTAAVKAASDYESAFAGVRKTVDMTEEEFSVLSSSLRDMAKEMPASAVSLAEVAEAAGQLGIKNEDILSFTETMTKMGVATDLSANEAATALARFANVMGMDQSKFENLGSSIVSLGNNFATTESEIVQMGLRLSGVGKQIGLSEADVMGLAAAMSSVGIEAEAGGSAMTQSLKKMQNSVENFKGSAEAIEEARNTMNEKDFKKFEKSMTESLNVMDSFASTAGFTSEEFSKLFTDDPALALTKYVEGLQKASENGENLNSILEEVDIKGIREADAMLRLAGNSELLGEALKTSGKGWEENSALSNEAAVRYETLESKLQMLKNQLVDVAIEFGGPFVDAIKSGLDISQPFIKALSNIAKSFSEASPETQKMIMKTLAFTAAIGPASSLVGKATSLFGLGAKGIGKFAQKMGMAQVESQIASGGLKVLTGGLTSFSGGATVATKGIGSFALTTAGLNPVVLGAVAALTAGVAVWELWGKEAVASARRTNEWGYDVGAQLDSTLGAIKSDTQEASGQFSLMESGFSADTDKIVANFERIGSTIQNELTEQIDSFKESLGMLPEEIKGAAEEIVNEGIEKRENALALVEENNQRVLEIKKKFVDNEGKVTMQGALMIQDLMKQSTQEYLNITVADAEARKEVMSALTGDVESATEQQAEAWLRSLGKQRQETKTSYTEQLNEYKDYLDKKGILNTDEGKQLVDLFEKARDQSSQSLDAQMALIVEKYPELADKILLANGQLISGMGEAGAAAKKSNEDILKNAESLSNKLSATAKRNAIARKWEIDDATNAGKIWNDLQLLDKEGNVKSNASEIVTEASKDVTNWNRIRTLVHDVNLDSNAKKIIGEAAIANGWWEGMAWEDKQAVLEDEFSQTMYKVLEDAGKWDEMSLDEKKAIIYSNTPEVMAETMLKLGMWEEFQPEIKKLGADNYGLLNALSSSEEALNQYNALDPDFKELLAADPATLTVQQSTKILEVYNSLKPEFKRLLGDNTNVNAIVGAADTKVRNYDAFKPGAKHLHATSDTSAVDYMRSQINGIPDITVKWIELQTRGAANPRLHGPGYAKGTNYHKGGPAVLGDGGRHEPFLTPSGIFGISPKTDTLFPNLEKGTKVWSSIQKFKKDIPHFANGTDYSNTTALRFLSSVSGESSIDVKQTSLSQKMDELIFYLKKQNERPIIVENTGKVVLDNQREIGNWLGDTLEKYSSEKTLQNIRLMGGGTNRK